MTDNPTDLPPIAPFITGHPGPVTTRFEGDVAIITVDDGKANALSFEIIDSLSAALDAAFASSKAVIIMGREGKFSAGFDLKIMTGGIDGARRLLASGAHLALKIYTAPRPVVLGVTGHAMAMGGILTTCADYRVGARGYFNIGLNEVAIGMPVPAFAVEMCRDRLNPAWFTRCLQHAVMCSPKDAVEAGFLDETTEMDSVELRCQMTAQALADSVQPRAFELTRINMRGALAGALLAKLEADMASFDVTQS